jgi:hypothetical protein
MGQSASQFFTAGHGWNYFGHMMGNLGLLVLSSIKTGVVAGLGISSALTGNPLGAIGAGRSFVTLAAQMKSFIQSDGQDLNSDLKKLPGLIGDPVMTVINAVSDISNKIAGEHTGATELGIPVMGQALPTSSRVNVAPALADNMYKASAAAMGMNRTLNPMDASKLAGSQKMFNQVTPASAQQVRDSISPLVNASFLVSAARSSN